MDELVVDARCKDSAWMPWQAPAVILDDVYPWRGLVASQASQLFFV